MYCTVFNGNFRNVKNYSSVSFIFLYGFAMIPKLSSLNFRCCNYDKNSGTNYQGKLSFSPTSNTLGVVIETEFCLRQDLRDARIPAYIYLFKVNNRNTRKEEV